MSAKQRKNPIKDRYVAVNVTEEDIAYARKKNRYACGIVRAIQRQIPEALRVTADRKTIRFSLNDWRYEFITPDDAIENVIKPLDTDQPTQPYSFQLVNAVAAWPVKHMSPEQKRKTRNNKRLAKPSRIQVRTQNTSVSTYNRFKDDEVDG